MKWKAELEAVSRVPSPVGEVVPLQQANLFMPEDSMA